MLNAETIATRKTIMRREMRNALRVLRPPLPDVAGVVAAWLRGRANLRRIAMFAPLPGEPDLLPLLVALPDISWCFPRVVDEQTLAFHEVKCAGNLRSAALGILEPAEGAPAVAPDGIDAFLCPGLGFDRTGGRLGRGRGYYDRMLAKARADVVKAGVCFACQLVESTFHEAHDVRMDVVICESGIATLAE